MGVAQPVKPLTESEYLEIERRAEIKSEFFDGEMFAMSGGTRWHSLIATNLAREFGNRLKGHRCVPYNADLRVKVVATGLLTYPDLTVVCGEPQLLDDEMDTLLNPAVVVEVLSDSTEAYDRGKKFEHYRQIPSLLEYLLVSQKEPRMEQFVRQESGFWLLREAASLDASIELPSLKISVALAEVFANVKFPPAAIHPTAPPRG
ncbi:MAG: Uma2 family endonuclease [Verrucomicrobia bacterium]|nr:Uma2 family endonuclease [Verrucomicrobiota bacterium]